MGEARLFVFLYKLIATIYQVCFGGKNTVKSVLSPSCYRKVNLSFFSLSTLLTRAPRAENLGALPSFKGLNIPRSKDGNIDPVTDLFRTDWPGVTTGPVVSQFILSDFLIDSIRVEPKAEPLQPGMDYMTAFRPWLDVQVSKTEQFLNLDGKYPFWRYNTRLSWQMLGWSMNPIARSRP